jgi:hypothetical protein
MNAKLTIVMCAVVLGFVLVRPMSWAAESDQGAVPIFSDIAVRVTALTAKVTVRLVAP